MVKNKVTTDISKNINKGIVLLQEGISIKKIEIAIDNHSFHKLAPLIKEHYPNKLKLSRMDIQFLVGKLREYELKYIKITAERKKGQTQLKSFFGDEKNDISKT